MHFDVAAIPANEAYKLLVSTVVPRPMSLWMATSPSSRTIRSRTRVSPSPAPRYLCEEGSSTW